MILWYGLVIFVASVGAAAKNITFFILHEVERPDLPDTVTNILNGLSQKYTNALMAPYFFEANRQKAFANKDQVCQTFQKVGATFYVDLTMDKLDRTYHEIFLGNGVPTVWLEYTFAPILKAVEQYMMAREAADMVLIFEREHDVDVALYNLLNSRNGIRVVIFDKLSQQTIKQIKMLRPAPSYYVVFATTKAMMEIFEKAVSSDLVKIPNKWNLIFLDFKYAAFDATHQKYPDVSKLIMEAEYCCRFLLLSVGCECPDEFSMEKAVLTIAFRYIIETIQENDLPTVRGGCDVRALDAQTLGAMEGMMKQMFAKLQYETPLAEEAKKLTSNISMSIYSSANDSDPDVVKIGQIDQAQLRSAATVKRAKRFLYIGAVEAIPWSWPKRDPITKAIMLDANGQPQWEGYCIDFMQTLSERMLFDYEIVPPTTGRFGKRIGDRKWDGAIGDLYAGNTDMIIAPLKMTAEREEIIDFVAPYFEQTGILIVMRNPVRETSLFKFMTVLKLEVWLSIVGALIATAIALWLLDKYSPYSAKNNKEAYAYPCRDFTLKESFWFALTSFTPQGGGEAPKAISARTLVAAYWLFVVLILATFTANLAAFLTVERMQTPVQSLEQLSRQSRINYTVVEGSDTHQYFINMKFAEDTLYTMWKEITLNSTSDQLQFRVWDYPIKEQWGHILMAINASQPVRDAREGFAKVNAQLNADFAFIHDSAEIRYEISRNCNLTEVGEIMAEQPYAVGVQQGSQLQDEISRHILELQQDRFFELLKAKYWNSSAKGLCPNANDDEGITLESLGGVFIATLFGLALAMVTLVFEVIYHKKRVKIEAMEVVRQKIKHNIFSVLPAIEETAKQSVTIGDTFVPAAQKHPKSNYISVFSRNSIHEHNQ